MLDLDLELVSQELSSGGTSSGCNCHFIDLENGWGIKCYEDYDCYIKSIVVQSAAAKKEIAPQTGKSFMLNDYYCFVTEVAEILTDEYGYDNNHINKIDNLDSDVEDEIDDANEEFYSVFDSPYLDDHSGNYGRLKNGKIVVIDFDRETGLAEDLIMDEDFPDDLIKPPIYSNWAKYF